MDKYFFLIRRMRLIVLAAVAMVALFTVLGPTVAQAAPQQANSGANAYTARYGKDSYGHGKDSYRPSQQYHRPRAQQPHRKICANSYTVRKGDTLSAIATRHGTTVRTLMQENHLRNANRIVVGQRLCVPTAAHHPPKHDTSCQTHYVVGLGDTLSKIARHHHTTVHSLKQANNLHNANRIYAGQRLCIR